jgi:hypothetical protein
MWALAVKTVRALWAILDDPDQIPLPGRRHVDDLAELVDRPINVQRDHPDTQGIHRDGRPA